MASSPTDVEEDVEDEEAEEDEEGSVMPSFGVLHSLRSEEWAGEADAVVEASAAAEAAASVEGGPVVTGSTKRLTRHQHRRIVRSVERKRSEPPDCNSVSTWDQPATTLAATPKPCS